MFCTTCGQLIEFIEDHTHENNEKLIHSNSNVFPFLDNHEPKMCEVDAARHQEYLDRKNNQS